MADFQHDKLTWSEYKHQVELLHKQMDEVWDDKITH